MTTTDTPYERSAPADETSEDANADLLRVALVPIANPETAPALLRLAAALVHPEEGRIVALIVTLGDVESQDQTITELEEIVEEFKAGEVSCELFTEVSTSIARGILDTAGEIGADLIVLGLQTHDKGEVALGTVVESVLQTAPCDVLIYRSINGMEFGRVVIPVDTTHHTRIATWIGLQLARRNDVPIEAIYTQQSHRPQYEGLARIEEVISGIRDQRRIKRTVVTAHNPVESILARTGEEDLIIVSFNGRSDFERWMYGDIARGVMERAAGPVMMVSRAIEQQTQAGRAWRRALGWLRPALTRVEQDEIVRQAREMASIDIDYAILILVSATIATLGLLLNSPAVIIGAMLVAPFISPLIAFSASLTVGRVLTSGRALVALAFGVGASVLVAALVGWLLPTNLPTAEMLARGTPTLIDAAVAFAGGIIGAYATARKDIPAALAGVAIAAALMPPLCTVGLSLAFGETELAFGAALLFLTNIIAMVLAAMAVFVWLGMSFRRYEHIPVFKQAIALILLVLVAIPVGYELVTLTRQFNEDTVIRQYLRGALDPAELMAVEVRRGDPVRVLATVRTGQALDVETVRAFEESISAQLDQPIKLDLIVLQIISVLDEIVEEAEGEIDGTIEIEVEIDASEENGDDDSS
jgi:uncharacterized hydrophobic protein (TIGR00271 family)